MLPRIQPPSYVVCIAQILADSTTTLSIDELTTALKEHRPLNKGTRSAIYRALNKLYQAVPVQPGRYGWFSSLLQDNLFRHPLITEEARRGYLLMDELEHAIFFPQFFQTHRADNRVLTVQLLGGPAIRAEAYIEHKTWSLRLGYEFAQWIDRQGGRGRDDILIRVDNADTGHYTLRLQPREARDELAVRERNLLLTQVAESIVDEDRRERQAVPTWELAARLIARGVFSHPTPPDDLHYVLHEYSLLQYQRGAGYLLDNESKLFSSNLHVNRGEDDSRFSSARSRGQVLANQRPASSIGGYPQSHTDAGGLANDLSDLDSHERDMFFDLLRRDFLGGLTDESALDEESEWAADPIEEEHPFDYTDENCQFYQEYLDNFYEANEAGAPLSHGDYHLLEAEIEMLVGLEAEFGHLMPEQAQRCKELAARLYLDPSTLFGDDSNHSDFSDYSDDEEWPFWEN